MSTKKKSVKKAESKQSAKLIEPKPQVSLSKKILIGSGLGLLGLLVILIIVVVSAVFFYQNRIYPNVVVSGIKVGGLTKPQAQKLLDDDFNIYKKDKIVVTSSEGKTWTKSPADLGFSPSSQPAVKLADGVGRGNNIGKNLSTIVNLFANPVKVNLDHTFDQAKLDQFVADIAKEANVAKHDATLQITADSIVEIEPQAGLEISQDKLTKSIKSHISTLEDSQINLTETKTQPIVLTAGLAKAKATAETYLNSKITLNSSGRYFVLDRAKIAQIIDFKAGSEPVANNQGVYLEASINNDKLNDLIKGYTKLINVEPVNAVLGVKDGQVVVTTNSVQGKTVDQAALNSAITSAITAGSTKTIDVPVKTTDAQLSNDFSKLGIKDLIGTATTSFGKHIDNRLHNIKLGASSINGYLLKPGQEFSTLGALGPIDQAHGYLPELVILNDKVTPADGGGLCQVSTTLFRAALNAGMPITQRRNHSLRVSYYEPPVGLDATIYSPSPDFKFKNDTANWMLIQSRVVGNTITFDLFGTSDGRKSQIIGPTLLYETAPPATKYIDNPNLPAGQLQKVQGAFPGGKATATYNVFDKDGKQINHQVFNSVYDAVGAIYYRGTKK